MLSAVKDWFRAPVHAPSAEPAIGGQEPGALPSDGTGAAHVGTRGDAMGTRETAFQRLCASRPHLAPRDASIESFVLWLQELGECWYSWEQAELYGEYECICALTRNEPVPWKWFGRALDKLGCHRWKADVVTDGRRRRPMFVRIPEEPTAIETQQSQRPSARGARLHIVKSDPSQYPSRLVGTEAAHAFA